MPLPPRPFDTLSDIANRWWFCRSTWSDGRAKDCSRSRLRRRRSRPAPLQTLCDLVEIAGTDVLPLFRPDGTRLDRVQIRRVRAPGETGWQFISEPADGLSVAAHDVLVTRSEVQRFERQHGLRESGISQGDQPARPARRRTPGPGAPPRYDWDTFFAAITRRVYAHGLPSTQSELVREMLDWFQTRSVEQTPDESTVRRKVALVWRELTRA